MAKTDPIMHVRLTENRKGGEVWEGSFRQGPLDIVTDLYQYQGDFKRFEIDIVDIGKGCPKSCKSPISLTEFLDKIGIKTY